MQANTVIIFFNKSLKNIFLKFILNQKIKTTKISGAVSILNRKAKLKIIYHQNWNRGMVTQLFDLSIERENILKLKNYFMSAYIAASCNIN